MNIRLRAPQYFFASGALWRGKFKFDMGYNSNPTKFVTVVKTFVPNNRWFTFQTRRSASRNASILWQFQAPFTVPIHRLSCLFSCHSCLSCRVFDIYLGRQPTSLVLPAVRDVLSHEDDAYHLVGVVVLLVDVWCSRHFVRFVSRWSKPGSLIQRFLGLA